MRMLAVWTDNDVTGLLVAIGFGVCVLVIVMIAFMQKRTAALRMRLAELERMVAGSQTDDVQRNTVMYEQHRQMNALQIEKMQTELAMMQREGAKFSLNAEQEKDRYLAEREFHEIMVEKNRLEIENLRLHIRELRKRMEDWGSGHE